jgi:hypothetical protein
MLDDDGGRGFAGAFGAPPELWAAVLDWLIVLRLAGAASTARAAPKMPAALQNVTPTSRLDPDIRARHEDNRDPMAQTHQARMMMWTSAQSPHS